MDATTAFVVGALAGSICTVSAFIGFLMLVGAVTIFKDNPVKPEQAPGDLTWMLELKPEPPPAPKRNGTTYVEPGSMKRSTVRAENPSYLNRQN